MTTKSTPTKTRPKTPKIAQIVKQAPSAVDAPAKINPEELIAGLEAGQLKKDLPQIEAGSTVAIHQLVAEKGGKVRVQVFEGVVIKSVRQNKLSASISVRKVASGVGVERTFFLHSPLIQKVEVKKRARVRRAKLYFLRKLSGKAAQQKEIKVKTSAAQSPAKKDSAKS